ncbi:MAG: 2-oxo acid dehydrogenase subunit E2 [bacterium]|nr:2-oxo acid dehydrogenase subunit E2 [bacterium]
MSEEKIIPLTGWARIDSETFAPGEIVPQVGGKIDVDMSKIIEWRKEIQPEIEKKTNLRLNFAPIFVQVVAQIIEEFPLANATIRDNQIHVNPDINIGLVMSAGVKGEAGPVVVIREANKKTLEELVSMIHNLSKKVKKDSWGLASISQQDDKVAKRLQKIASAMKGKPTFILNIFGLYGVDIHMPFLPPGQGVVLVIGRITKRAVVVKDEIVIRPMATLYAACDHRLGSGVVGARFLHRIKQVFENVELKK